MFELNFYQDQKNWKHNLLPIEISKNNSERVFDFLIYKNFFALTKSLHVFLGDHRKMFFCRRCLNSCTSENMLMIHKRKCENYDITNIRTSSESHLPWKDHFRETAVNFRIIADLEAYNELDNSSIGNKTIKILK